MPLIIKTFFKKIFFFVLNLLSPKLSCDLNNIRQKFFRRNFFFHYDKSLNLYYVCEENLKMYFPDRLRGIHTYSYGIMNRATQLIQTYNLELIKFSNNDVVIDCGANYGDLYTWLKSKDLNINYISFEPSPLEFKCLQLNCLNQNNNNIALSDINGDINFFLKTDSGDSSTIEPSTGYTEKIKVKSCTLSSYVLNNKIQKIKFLKIEAEGSEPEVLKGSKEILSRVDYIGVDGSPERGIKNETTIDYAIEFLNKNGFKVEASNINKNYAKALFKNKNI